MPSASVNPTPVPWPTHVVWVGPEEIREHFNTNKILAQLERGALVEGLWKDHHLRTPQTEPFCTRSQIVIYWTVHREPVALVHQYLRPDGSLGASQRPDPKRLVVEGIVYATKG